MNKIIILAILLNLASCQSDFEEYDYNYSWSPYSARHGYLHYLRSSDTSIQISEIKYLGSNRAYKVTVKQNIPIFLSLFDVTHLNIETNKGNFSAILQPIIYNRSNLYNSKDDKQNIYKVKESNFNKYQITIPFTNKIETSNNSYYVADTLIFE
jgi:hypothetical protein